ncbi:MAG: hypothetical protein KJ069_12450 [Anaerolineae bacterium]|nr:hypothetical protein [Anaerolineae bacterium]
METEETGETQSRPGIPIYIDDSQPEIDDPANLSNNSYWFPANNISIKLATCLESIRDIERLLAVLVEQDNPSSDKRIVKLMATPLYSLASGVRDLFNDLQGNAKEYAQIKDKQKRQINRRLPEYLRAVPLQDGDLRTIRDKISSHVDKDVFTGNPRRIWELVDLDVQLEWLRTIIDELMFLLSLDAYAWTRDSGDPAIFRLMSVDGVQVDLNLEEYLILDVTMVKSPKYYISTKIQEIATLYKRIKSKRG